MKIEKWSVNKEHSEIGFSVRHMMVSRVKGNFLDFSSEIEADLENLEGSPISFTIDASTIDTGNEDRDNHLRSVDFFDVEKYPEITFKATDIIKKSENNYELTGDMTMLETTLPVTFMVEYHGQIEDTSSGETIAGIHAFSEINRKDFGLNWNGVVEAGGVVVSDEVKITVDLQLRK